MFEFRQWAKSRAVQKRKKLSKKELINRIWREIPGIGYMPPTDNIKLPLRDNDKPAFYVAKSEDVMLLDSKNGVIYIAESQNNVEKIASLEVESAGFDWLSL